MQYKKNSYILLLVWIVFFLPGIQLISIKPNLKDITIIKNPKPNSEEKIFSELFQVAELKENLDSEFFLVDPFGLAVDKDGNIFTFDRKQVKLVKYNKYLKFVKAVGQRGYGPSEFNTSLFHKMLQISLYLGQDNILYVGDRSSRAIHCFDLDLKFIKDIRIHMNNVHTIFPVIDGKKNFYIHSGSEISNSLLEIFNYKGEKIAALIDKRELSTGLFYCFEKDNILNYFYPGYGAINYDIAKDDNLIAIIPNSGVMFLIKDLKVVKKISLWPKKLLENYKIELKKTIDEKGAVLLYGELIVDRDSPYYFYLTAKDPENKKRDTLYKFDLSGKLIKVISIDNRIRNHYLRNIYKKNNYFYGIGNNNEEEATIMIFKEEKQ